MFNEFNKAVKKWSHNTTNFEYIKLKDFLATYGNNPIKVYGYYINELDNGKNVTIIAEDCYINLPSHAVKVFESFTDTHKAAIDQGKLELANFREATIKRFNQKTIYFDYLDC